MLNSPLSARLLSLRVPSLRVLLAAGLLSLAGCSESSTNGEIGVVATASLSTSVVAFGNSPVGMTSVTQSVVLTAVNGSVGFNGVSVIGANPGDFLVSSNCPANITKGASCNITVAFAPLATGARTATLQIGDSASNSPQLVTLTGTGTATGPIVSLSATSLTFTSLPIGQASTQTVTLSNIGSASLSLSGFTLGGANATSFSLSGSCLTTSVVTTSTPCFLTVTYAPTVSGSLNAVVNVNDNAPNSPQVITLASK
jgi:hypothetical protein